MLAASFFIASTSFCREPETERNGLPEGSTEEVWVVLGNAWCNGREAPSDPGVELQGGVTRRNAGFSATTYSPALDWCLFFSSLVTSLWSPFFPLPVPFGLLGPGFGPAGGGLGAEVPGSLKAGLDGRMAAGQRGGNAVAFFARTAKSKSFVKSRSHSSSSLCT